MNNLKRVLSLALSGIMLVGMMSVGASAAGFTDADKISNTDAVNTLVSLGVINGKDDGSYGPEEIVTRSQMAKMITVALNGGKDFKYGTKATPTYTDIKGHWAESYIEYCTSLNIIAGQGDGTFNPDAPVTASAASKMLLVAIGYDADDEGMVGVDWEVNTNRLADNKGFYKSLGGLNVSDGLTRDNAAQVIYNACGAKMVEYDYKLVTDNGNLTTKPIAKDYADGRTILTEKFELLDKVGYLTSVSYNKDKDEYTYNFDNGTIFGIASSKQVEADDLVESSLKADVDYSHVYGQLVRVLYKNDSKNTVLGMYPASDKVVATTKAQIEGDVVKSGADGTETSFKVDGVKYDLAKKANETPVFVAPESDEFDTTNKYLDDMLTSADVLPCASVTFVGDGKIDYVVLTPVKVGEVTFISKDSVTVRGVGAYKFEDDVIEDGLKKGDYVSVIEAANSVNGKNTVAKLDTASGTAEAVRSGEAKVAGKWYKYAAGVSALTLGEEYDLFIIGNYIYSAEQTSESAKLEDLVLVSSVADDATFGTVRTKLYFTDGSNKIVDVSEVDGETVDDSTKPTKDTLYSYTIKNGNYRLTAVDTDNKLGMDGIDENVGAYVKDDKKLGNYFLADDAVVFVKTADGKKYEVYTGAEAKKWSDFGAGSGNIVLFNTVNGMKTAKAAYVVSANNDLPADSGSTKYGFVTTTPEQVKDGEDKFWSYTIWTEDGSVDVLDEDSTTLAAKGLPISYTDLGGDKVKGVALIDTTPVAITGINGDNLAIHEASGKLSTVTKKDDDTVILYVNTKDDAGVEGGELAIAGEQDNGSYITNAWLVPTSDGKAAKVIVYDVNNDLDNYKNDAASGRAGYAVDEATIASTPAGWTISQDKTFAVQGEKVTITITSDGTGTQTTAATAVTGIDATVADVTLTASTAGSYTIEFLVEDEAVTAITVTLS